ncbi:MAG: caspase family protein [Betaproteobacteria bacterium]|nr:caspase family protein [Betaproteobacteria bacterium]
MKLQPAAGEPGLWVNPNWQEGQPGAFAVVIGVSRYEHLEGGASPAQEAYGLGQLAVSALTAFEVFRWLDGTFRVAGCPLARCWLLLSPTAQEVTHDPTVQTHCAEPTFDNCKKALKFWHYHMNRLPAAAAEHSRALFFFSGHGLEVHQEHQVLLPSDYLAPPSPSLDDAISTDNLKKGLASLAVRHHFFFLDACRNDHQALRAKNLRGATILTEDESALTNAERVAPQLYATASGQQAYQQPEPGKGLSLFGRALLDGLAGAPDLELDCAGPLCAVNLYPLHGYVKRRVIELIEAAKAQVRQPVKLSGIVDNEAITFVDRPHMLGTPPTTPPPVRGIGPKGVREASPVAEHSRALHERALTVTRSLDAPMGERVWTQDYQIAHDLFGSENVTAFWTTRLRVFRLGRRDWLDANAVRLYSVERDEETRTYRVDVEFVENAQDNVGHWLQTSDGAGTLHACVLSTDKHAPPIFSIEFDVSFDDGSGRRLSRLDAYLSLRNTGLLGAAAEMWSRYRTADVGEAVSAFELTTLEQMVREKLDSPLAATVAGIILLRANRLDRLYDWLRNLANWFPERPDGSALWAEQLMRRPAERKQAISEAADYLADLTTRGLPHTAEGLSYAVRLADVLVRLEQKVPQREKLEALAQRIQNALPFFRPGGLFAAYGGFPADTDPEELIGPHRTGD